MRRLRWIVLVVALLVAATIAAPTIAALLLVRPDLEDGRDRVDAEWAPLRPALIARYEALDGVVAALREAGAGERSVTTDLAGALDRWRAFALRGPRHTDPAAEVELANRLEELARRMRANLIGSERLKANDELAATVATYDQAVVPQPSVRSYNRAVRSYEDERSGFPARLLADVLGYESRPLVVIGMGA